MNLANKKGTILEIGREFYNTPKSIYDNLYLFESKGLVTIIKLRKDLKIKITEKGKKVLESLYILYGI
jgi:DNA-binding PadR family transcriptional regulator